MSFESESLNDTLDSISLKKSDHYVSSQSLCTESSFIDDLLDLDINALDEEIKALTSECQNKIHDLRTDPSNLSKKQSIIQTKEKLNQIKVWTSKLSTEEGQRLLKARQKDTEKRQYEIDQVLKIVKAQSAVDICFLMDCTYSMLPYINEAKNSINKLTNTITTLFKTLPRLAFIGYRDFECGMNNLIECKFTSDIDAFRKFLDGVNLIGNSDYCEDVFSGLEAVSTLEWSNPNRILIHVCDAPCHGRDYYDKVDELRVSLNRWDHFPNGDPRGRNVCKLLLDMKRQNIQYFSVQLGEYVEKMFNEFQLIYGSIHKLHVAQPTNLINTVSRTVTDTIMTTINDTMSVFKTTEKRKVYRLSNEEPNWNIMNIYPTVITEYIVPKTLEELFRPLYVGTGNGKMQIAANPFAQGGLRYAYYGKLALDGFNMLDVVYKELISDDPRYNILKIYKQHLEIHTIAQCLANLFNEAQRKVFRRPVEIYYADANIVHQTQDPTKIYQVERRFKQTMQKWNNNCGGIHFEEYSTILQAFSHWTHHQTAGRMMVVDLQGVKSSEGNRYLLTDPAIHFDDLKRYRDVRTNLGGKGMREFFRTHVCSKVCEKLGLQKVINEIDDDITKEFYKPKDLFTLKEDPAEDEEGI